VLMVGGNIPGETRVVSIAIYDQVESLNYAAAHQLSALLLVVAFVAVFSMFLVNRRWRR
jgi:molybdate transport system permease protein